ncbi:transcription factor 7-like isoform 2-T2 [Spinachia spinachia]
MDASAEFDRLTGSMDEREILNTLCAMMEEMLVEHPNVPPPAPSPPSAPPVLAGLVLNTKPQPGSQPYIKKPPNAFILFSREQRPSLNTTGEGSGSQNKTLGQMWLLLPSEEKAKYLDMAIEERHKHALKHPNWSCKENYGTKIRKRNRRLSRAEGRSKHFTSYLTSLNHTSLYYMDTNLV